jgi:FkbM family methyltransferase
MFQTKNKFDLDEKILEKKILRNKTINYIKNDTCIGHFLKSGIYWEEWMFKYIKQNYIENTNMIDLGGNIGTTTLLMSEVLSQKCKIFTFEPIYNDILLKNIFDNNLANNVEVYPYGLGNKIETLKIKPINLYDNINFGAMSLVEHLTEEDNSFNINIVPIDYFNFENISLIKVDVENMEVEVLEGCLELIKRCKPTIIIETHQLPQFKETNIFKQLLSLEYGIESIPEGHNDFIMKVKSAF